jgi:hypothetical protein
MGALWIVGFIVFLALALGSGGGPTEQRFVVTFETAPEADSGCGCGTAILFLLIALGLLALLGAL